MHRLAELPPAVRNYLCDFVTRWRRLVALRAAGTALLAFAVWMIAAATLDRIVHLPASLRLGSLVAASIVAIVVGILRLRELRGEVDWVAMAAIIEQHDPRFNQALVTVTSRILGSPDHRGSDEILSHLLREVEHCAADPREHKLFTFRSAAGPWAFLLILVLGLICLSRVPGLGAPRLVARFVQPLADVPPVTTTELRVVPRDTDVLQSEPLHIDVEAMRLGINPVLLHISDDGVNWTQYSMDDSGNGRFTYTINAVGRDLVYQVTGGDAVSGPFTVHVKRPPAVAEFRIRYTFPEYTGRPPFTVTNTDGTIEAPVGSEAALTIVATEPLQSALLSVGGQKILMDHSHPDEPNVRQATLHIQNDLSYELDLISTREVRGGPGKMLIRATADHPPLARLFQAGQTLRLNPRDILPLTYQAMDDFGLEDIAIVAQVNADAPVRVPLHIVGDHRRQEETVNFDLGSLRFNVGDILSLTIAARDTASQETTTDELRVLISPRSIDLDAHERIEELSAAAGYASTLATEFESAGKATEEADGQKDHLSPAYLAAAGRASRHLTSASEAATLLRQALLRTAAHSNTSELSIALCAWIDTVHQETEVADESFRKGGTPDGMGGAIRDQLRHAFDVARELHSQIRTASQGERAAAVLADREDFKAASAVHPPANEQSAERLAKTLSHINGEIIASAADVGVNASASDADNQLRSRVEAAKNIVRSKQPIDFASTARDWSQSLQRDPHQHSGLDTRLATAAQVEAVRKDADLQCARDQELASRAAAVIEGAMNQIPPGKPVPAGQLNGFATAMAALQREHVMSRQPANSHSADEFRVVRNVAGRAREELARWAGESKDTKNVAAAARATELESLALRAGAEASRREYKHVAEEDKALVQKLTDVARKPGGKEIAGDVSPAAAQAVEERIQHIQQTAEKVKTQMSAAEAVDKLGQTQEKLLQEAKQSRNASRDLAGRQQNVAEQIADVERQGVSTGFPTAGVVREMDDPNWRGRATAALLFAQEELAAMPQALAATQEANDRRHKAADRAAAARAEVEKDDPDRRAMAIRAADQADKDAQDAAAQFDKISSPVAPQMAADLADRLEPFSPEASTAREMVVGSLAASLKAFESACDGTNADAVSHAANDTLKAIDAVQKELVHAQDDFTERDPLIAAKWFARAAADSLARHPADLRTALAHQNNVSLALSSAWNRSIHRASELRLAELPSLQAVYSPSQTSVYETTATATAQAPNPGSHDWAHLHAREGDDLTATMHEPDPPGFEEPLRLYFEALGKAQEKPK